MTSKQNQELEYGELIIKGFQITDVLSNSQGTPENWQDLTSDQIKVLGLSNNYNKISIEKLNAFTRENLIQDLNYTKTRQLLEIQNYNYYFKLKNLDNLTEITSGKNPETNCSQNSRSVNINRYVLLEDNKRAKLTLSLWKC